MRTMSAEIIKNEARKSSKSGESTAFCIGGD